MTNREAAKWIQLYIDLAKIDPTTGEAAYLNEDARKTLEAMGMAIKALTKEAWKEEHPVSPLLQKLATTAQAEERTENTRKTHACDCIERQAAIDAIQKTSGMLMYQIDGFNRLDAVDIIKNLPSAQPEPSQMARDIATIIENEKDMRVIAQPEPEITDEQAIEHLQSSGWMQNHDKQMYEMGLRERLADDSDSYDALLPSVQPDIIRCKECTHQVKEWRTDKRLKDNGYYACGCDVVGDACGYWALLGQDDDYCSMAERKGNG